MKTPTKKEKENLKSEVKKDGGKATKKIKKGAKQVKKKTKQAAKKVKQEYNSPRGKKVREWVKKTSEVIGSHLATIRAGVTLSNEEAKLMESLKEALNKKGIYPSKSEIIRAGLWNLKKMSTKQLEEALKELVKVKQTHIL